jgi:deoxyribonuclease I
MARLPSLNWRAIWPWLVVFHPRGPFKKAGPWIALTLCVALAPIALVPQARERALEAIAGMLPAAQGTGGQPIGPGAPANTTPSGPPAGFDPMRVGGAFAPSAQDLERTQWSWNKAKSFAATIWEAQIPQTAGTYSSFYCGCTITRTGDSSGDVDLSSCAYQSPGNVNRARRLEWEHIVPASRLGQGRACWTTGLPACTNAQGVVEPGRECCEQADPVYQMMSSDPVNLAPAVGEVNAVRSNHPFGMVDRANATTFGAQCGMAVDAVAGRAEPPDGRKGDVARVMAYMSRAYGLTVPAQDADLYVQWMAQDPVSDEERAINAAIAAAGHRPNPFVMGTAGQQ